jgi:hypothetical protein
MSKTPSPVTAKRRLSTIPTKTGSGQKNRVVSEQLPRIKDYSDWKDDRRGSFGNASENLKGIDEDTGSIDSSMGFRELEKVSLFRFLSSLQKHIAEIKRQNFDLKLEVHLRRQKMTADAVKLERAERLEQEVSLPSRLV